MISHLGVKTLLNEYLFNLFFASPSTEVKIRMAKAIVEQFPVLKDVEGEGYVSTLRFWY